MSTQGLTNAQIAETLAAKEANTAKNYQAMADAGLLKHKQKLTLAQVQQNLQTVLGRDADTSAAMAALGLSGAIEGEEHQIVQITAKKLQEAMASGELTQAQAQELAMRTGITVSMNAQATGVLPRLIASMKATTASVWLQVKAQAAMMATNPMTWIMGIAAAVGVVKTKYKQSLEETRQKAMEAANTHKQAMETLASHKKTVNELSGAYRRLSKGVDTDTNQNLSLPEEDYQSYLSIVNELADIFPALQSGLDENGNALLSLGKNGQDASARLKELLEAEEDLNNYKVSQDISLLFTNVKEASDEAVKAAAKYEKDASSMAKSKQPLKELSENTVDLSGDIEFSGNISDEAGISYYNAITSSIQNFIKNVEDDTRRAELGNLFDLSLITDTDENGAFNIYLDTFCLSEEEKSQLQNEIKVQAAGIMLDLDNALEESFQEQKMAKEKAELAWKDYVPSIVATMKASGGFKGLAKGALGEDLQNFAVDLVSGLDQSVSQEIDKSKPDKWLKDYIIAPLSMLDESGRKEIIDAYNRLMELNPDDLADSNQGNVDIWVKKIAEMLGHTEAEIRLHLGFGVDEDLKAKYDTAIENASSTTAEQMQKAFDGYEEAPETYNEYGKITADQAQDIVDTDFKLFAA